MGAALTAVTGDWPMVGRADVREAVTAALVQPSGGAVAICGDAGIGKTRLAREVRASLASLGASVVHVVASPATRGVPLGVLAPLLPDDDARPADLTMVLRRAGIALSGPGAVPDPDTAAAPSGARVLSVDDAHHLDDVSAAALSQVVGEGLGLLVTARDGEELADPVARLLSLSELRTIRLDPLTRIEQDELLAAVLGAPVAPGSANELWHRSRGNPLVVREVLHAALAGGSMVHDGALWVLEGPVSPTAHLRALVADRLERAGSEVRNVLAHVALGEGMGFDQLASVVGADPVDEAERSGLVAVGADGRRRPVHLVHPFYGEVVVSQLTTAQRGSVLSALADAVRRAGARRRDDPVRVADWLLAGGGPADAQQLTAAARVAWSRRADVLARRLAHAAVSAGGDGEASLLLGLALSATGEARSAEETLAAIDVDGADDRFVAEVALARGQNLFWHLADGRAAETVLEAAAARIADIDSQVDVLALRLSQHLLAGETAPVVDAVEPLLEHLAPVEQVTAGWLLVPALTTRGEALRAVEVGERLAAVPVGDGPDEARVADHLGLLAGVVYALTTAGALDRAGEVGRDGVERSRHVGARSDEAWFCLMLGRIDLLRGRPVTAHGWFSDGERRFTEVGQAPLARWCTAGRVWSAAQSSLRGGPAIARRLAEPAPSAVRLMEPEVLRAQGWWQWRTRGRSAAAEVFGAAARMAASAGAVALEIGALHDLVRIGCLTPADRGRLDQLAGPGLGPLLTAMIDHGGAHLDRDSDGLQAVAATFEALGADLLAAEATASAWAHRRPGRGGDQHAPDRWRARLPEVTNHVAGAGPRSTSGAGRLTPREEQVVRLAVEGATNAEIADRLRCSARTVETHLGSAYRKLQVSGRRQLRRALAADDPAG